jgi:hypothetical protein
MTTYVAAYDTEHPDCLLGVQRIVEVHEKYDVPATFFMVAGLLDRQRDEYVALIRDRPLFEVACHTYSHMPLVDTPRYGKAGPYERFPHEIVDSKKRLEDVFGCRVVGFRPPVSAPDGLASAPYALDVIHEAGYRYVSSVAWGPEFSLPAPLVRPFTYGAQGFPNLWEFPACGWHENLLKGHNDIGPVLLCLFPPDMPETIPDTYVRTPEDEFRVNNKPFIDRAVQQQFPHVTLIWHPWSLYRLDPMMEMLERTFSYVREAGLRAGKFVDLLAECSEKD